MPRHNQNGNGTEHSNQNNPRRGDAGVIRSGSHGRMLREPPQPAPNVEGYRKASSGRFVGFDLVDPGLERRDSGQLRNVRDEQQLSRRELRARYGHHNSGERNFDQMSEPETSDTPTFDRGVFADASRTEADRGLSGPDLFESADSEFGSDESDESDREEFDRTVTVGVTPATLGDGFKIQTDDDRTDRTLGRGTEVVERADEDIGLPDAGTLDSTDVVAEAEIGLRDREAGFGETAEVIETRETDDTIFSYR